MTAPMENMDAWLHKPILRNEKITAMQANLMAATLDDDPQYIDGMELPNAWHWLYFNEAVKSADLAYDGHEKLGNFLPPIPLSYRMWAGGSIDFFRPLIVGKSFKKTSTVESITPKTGRSGPLCFVNVEHSIESTSDMMLYERQNIVYREKILPVKEPLLAPSGSADFEQETQPDALVLFRYSALTFNAHLIHYDRTYCKKHGYDDLVIHGPLIATQLLSTFKKGMPQVFLKNFTYKGISPLFVPSKLITRIKIQGEGNAIGWAQNEQGHLVQEASFQW